MFARVLEASGKGLGGFTDRISEKGLCASTRASLACEAAAMRAQETGLRALTEARGRLRQDPVNKNRAAFDGVTRTDGRVAARNAVRANRLETAANLSPRANRR